MNDFKGSSTSNEGILAVPPGDVVVKAEETQPKRGLSTKKLYAYIDERLGEHASAAASLVCDVVKRTRLWRKEKFDVACELIDHFQEAIEHGAAVDDAVRDFGNAADAAKMIRRSKLRCRSWWWRLRVSFYVAFGAMGVLYLISAIQFWTGQARPTVNYLAMVNAPVQAIAEEDRAWPTYMKVRAEVSEIVTGKFSDLQSPNLKFLRGSNLHSWRSYTSERRADEAYDRVTVSDGGAVAKQDSAAFEYDAVLQATRELVTQNPQIGQALRQAAAKSRLGWFFDSYMSKELPPSLFYVSADSYPLKTASNFLGWEAVFSVEQNNNEAAYLDLKAAFAVVRQNAEQDTFLVNQLVGLRLLSDTCAIVQNILIHHPGFFANEQLRGLAHQLATVDTLHVFSGQTERLATLDCLQYVYSLDAEGDGRLTYDGYQMLIDYCYNRNDTDYPFAYMMNNDSVLAFATGPFVHQSVAPRSEMTKHADDVMRELGQYLALPLWERKLAERPAHDRFEELLKAEPRRYELPGELISDYGRAADLRDVAEANRSATLVALALQLYHNHNDRYPDTLEPLTPGYLPAVPRDLATGGPMLYTRTDAGPVLYMAGEDEDDDGGVWPVAKDGAPDTGAIHKWGAGGWAREGRTPDGDWVLYPSEP